MSKVSIIIPSRNEVFKTKEGENVLLRTVRDIYEKATGDFEVIVGFDGPPYLDFPNYPNFRTLKLPEVIGIKSHINILSIMAKGDYIYKSDAHCMFGPSFDEILLKDTQPNWVVTPRFYILDGYNWRWQDDRHYDYFFLHCPFTDRKGFRFKAGGHWPERTAERENDHKYDIDETMQFHGSGWLVNRDFFLNKIGGYWTADPEGHAQEGPHLGLKTWLGPWNGKVMVNKKTWYAHMHQETRHKGFDLGSAAEHRTYTLYANYWMKDQWEERVHDLEWLVEKFMPIPTWPDNWREQWRDWKAKQNIAETVKYPTDSTALLYSFASVPEIKSRTDLIKYFASIGLKSGAEIGVHQGDFAKVILKEIPNLAYYGVDIWNNGQIYEEAKNKVAGYNAKLIKKASLDAADDFPDNSLDFVYIDAGHRFDDVMQDILKWAKKVRKGGIISGHDYNVRTNCGVVPAVNSYTKMHYLKLFVTTDISEEKSWWFVKRWYL